MYLDPAQAGVAWLLDPDDPGTVARLKAAAVRTPTDACDPVALSEDLADLLVLLRERHFGVATGVCDGTGLAEWAQLWQRRLADERPRTWGDAVGLDLLDLRRMLGDAHTKAVQHEDPERLAAADPRADEPVLVDDGPAYHEEVVDGVLCLRVRRLFGDEDDERALTAWRAAHERHFACDRIVVDLRGNRGGNDGRIPAGAQPWHGQMVVLTDRRTVSSGESSAWALRQMFGARLIGGPTEGCISFGFIVPYLLPRSGMRISLPTKQNLYPDVEFVGVPVDVPLDPRTPLEEIVERFF